MANTLHHHAQLQPKLTAGTNITINDDNVISAAGGTTFQYISENADSNTAVKITDDSLAEITVTKDSQTVITNNTVKVNAGSDTAGMLDLHAKFDSTGMLVWRGFSEETIDDGDKIINFDASGPVLNLGSNNINTYFKGSVYDKNGNEILAAAEATQSTYIPVDFTISSATIMNGNEVLAYTTFEIASDITAYVAGLNKTERSHEAYPPISEYLTFVPESEAVRAVRADITGTLPVGNQIVLWLAVTDGAVPGVRYRISLVSQSATLAFLMQKVAELSDAIRN